ncbi:MAG: membrane protein insertion efficiency factor YidD [Chlamydiia bacterium]|nr:membrane protein insertion efficiency factor YidD [Chlamydiia bacterium]
MSSPGFSNYPARAAISLLRWYKIGISPLLGTRCRFYPSCSVYAQDNIRNRGLIRGFGLTLWRLLRCGPWHPGGFDPAPEAREESTKCPLHGSHPPLGD